MRIVTQEEYRSIMPIFKAEMAKLAKHERKDHHYGQVAINSCYTRTLNDNLQLFQIFTPYFLCVMEDYLDALKENPECFGTYNAKDVIHALYIQAQKRSYPWNENRYTCFLSTECFCLLVCKDDTKFRHNVLRIDLFRQLDASKEHSGCYDFTGGIFHALKHFSVDEQCASIYPNQNVILYDIEQLIWPIAKAFFEYKNRKGKQVNTYETDICYLDKTMTLVIFKEKNSSTSFVNSFIPKSI